MANYSIFTLCSKNYRDAYDFVIDSWLRTNAKNIYVYTDDPNWKSDNERVKIIKLFDKESTDWLVNVARKYKVAGNAMKYGDEALMFLDIDCYIVNDIGYLFDKYDFDFAVTRLLRKRIAINSGLYLFRNTKHNKRFVSDWAVEQERCYRMGKGRNPYESSHSQFGFSNVIRRYHSQGTHKVIDLDPLRYHRKTGKPTLVKATIEDLKQNKIEILHFYARTWRSKDANKILSYVNKPEITPQGKLCVTTVVNRKYQKYIPTFLYFCLKSYPECGIKLFLTEELKPAYRDIVGKLRALGSIEIIESYYRGYPRSPQELKALRWMSVSEDFAGYDYVYTGDIDIIICREKVSLLDQHLNRCAETNLPYSNSVRPNSHRLSGLHFVKKNEYYNIMDHLIKNKYRKLLKSGALRGQKNEEILYNMVRKAKFPFPSGWFRPHHGPHLGLWRNGDRKIDNAFWDAVGRDNYKKYFEFFKSVKKDPLYEEVYRLDNLIEIPAMERALNKL